MTGSPHSALDRLLYLCAGIAGFLGIAFGAFGAHALRASLAPDMLAVFETGVRYQMYHVFALLAAAWAWARWQHRLFGIAGWLFVAGIIVFSGSLYLLALTGVRVLGAITPLGGLAFLAGWLCLAWGAAIKIRS
jgi:uncharacterized membrane protein YgdD (TMEM256/DUF423 family)